METMNSNVMSYIFSKKSMDLKNSAKPKSPAMIMIAVSIVIYVCAFYAKGYARNRYTVKGLQ